MNDIEEKAKRYFAEEGIVVRTREQSLEYLKHVLGDNGFSSLVEITDNDDHEGDENQMKLYDAVSVLINGFAAYDVFKSWRNASTLKRMVMATEHAMSNGSENVLDVGCATGLEACFIAENYPKSFVTGVDISRKIIDRANERAIRRKIRNFRFLEGNRDKLPFKPETFDSVVALQSLTEGNNNSIEDNYFIINHMIHQRLLRLKELMKSGATLVTLQASHPNMYNVTIDYNVGRIENAGFTVKKIDFCGVPEEKYWGVLFVAKKD